MPLGTISALWTYPIKALAPRAHRRVLVASDGLAGDRERALFVDTPEHRRFGKTLRGKENALLHTAAELERGVMIAELGGADVTLSEPARYFDAAPVSIVLDRWVHECERLAGVPIDVQRFRPNVVITADPAFVQCEAETIGATITIGAIELRIVDAIVRCVTPAYDLETGETNAAILRAVANDRKNILGIYAEVVHPGEIALDDPVELTQ